MSRLRSALKSPLVRSSGIYVASAILSGLVPFMLMPVLTRLLGPAGYGIVGTFAVLVNVTSVLVGLSTYGYVSVTYFREDRSAFPAAVAASVSIMAGSAALVALLAIPFAPQLAAASGVTPAWQWTVIAAAAGQFAITLTLTAWQVQGHAARYGAMQILTTALNLLVTVALVAWIGLGWEGRALAQASVGLILGAGGLMVLARSGMLTVHVSGAAIREALRFGMPLLPHALAGVVLAGMDRVIVSVARGSDEAGIYFAAFQISVTIGFVAAAINQAWVPWLFGHLASGDERAKARVVQATYAMCAFLGLAAAVLALLGPLAVRMLAGERFTASAELLPILAPAAALSGMYYLVANYIFYAKRTELLSAVTTVTAIIQAGLTIAWVTIDGARGAAFATLVSSALYLCLTWYVAHRLVPMPWLGALRRTR